MSADEQAKLEEMKASGGEEADKLKDAAGAALDAFQDTYDDHADEESAGA